jgi:peptidylprolyl isomerase
VFNKVGSFVLIAILSTVALLAGGCNGDSAVAKDGDIVKVHYTGTLEDGTVFDTSVDSDPLEFTLGEGSMLQGFEQAVRGLRVGQSRTVTIPVDEAYGPYDEELLLVFSREELPDGLEPEVGQELQLQTMDGSIFIVPVVDVSEETITVDANHPLAGQDLTFEVELVGIN